MIAPLKMDPTIIGKATVLAIGTELTTGQITNRNAAWISEKLVQLGIEVVSHLTVPDDHALIVEALDRCQAMSQLVFVTGGLGPTTDDFTRQVVATWLQQPLQYEPNAWDEIYARLTRLGIQVAESNRQQCFFPKGATILPNPQGTAAAFTNDLDPARKIWVLPGPPSEIAAIWEHSQDLIAKEIRTLVPGMIPNKLFSWQCIGKSEAELGEITEMALLGSQLKTGYRAHRPFVEIKVWCTESEYPAKQIYIQKLSEAIAPWVFTTQGEDLADRLVEQLLRPSNPSRPFKKIVLIDGATGGLLASRLSAPLRKFSTQPDPSRPSLTIESLWTDLNESPEKWVEDTAQRLDPLDLNLILGGFTVDGQGTIGFRNGSHSYQHSVQTPYRSQELLERTQRYAVEMALRYWSNQIVLCNL